MHPEAAANTFLGQGPRSQQRQVVTASASVPIVDGWLTPRLPHSSRSVTPTKDALPEEQFQVGYIDYGLNISALPSQWRR